MTAIGLLLAALVGLAIGLLGGGGAILAVPVFVYVLGYGIKEAVVASLVVVGVTSLFGAMEHWREGHVRLRVALVFGLVAAVGAYLGAYLASFLSGAVQLVIFATVMLVAAFFMLREGGSREDEKDDASSGSAGWTILGLVGPGVGVGVLTGLVGVGGGFMIVPALVLIGNIPMDVAVGTSLLVIAMNSAGGFVGYLGQVTVQWGFVALFSAVAIAGSFAGAYLTRFVPEKALRKWFAVFLIVMAILVLHQNRSVFF